MIPPIPTEWRLANIVDAGKTAGFTSDFAKETPMTDAKNDNTKNSTTDAKLREDATSGTPAQRDAQGQYGHTKAKPNAGGLHSANPVVLSGDGDATVGNGHGRDRDPKGSKSG